MNAPLESAAAFVSTGASAILGSKILPLLANAAPDGHMPDWMKWLLGPLGALVGMIVAIIWLSKRLNKAEEKADKREDERDNDRKLLITVVEQNSLFIKQANETLEDVKDAIGKTK